MIKNDLENVVKGYFKKSVSIITLWSIFLRWSFVIVEDIKQIMSPRLVAFNISGWSDLWKFHKSTYFTLSVLFPLSTHITWLKVNLCFSTQFSISAAVVSFPSISCWIQELIIIAIRNLIKSNYCSDWFFFQKFLHLAVWRQRQLLLFCYVRLRVSCRLLLLFPSWSWIQKWW